MQAQTIHDLLIHTPYSGIANRCLLKGANLVRTWMIRRSDPLIRADVGSYKLEMPLSHKLPHDRKNFATYNQALVDTAVNAAAKYPDFRAIDVGANVGDTIALWRTEKTFPVLAIEGEDRFFRILTGNTREWPDVALEKTYLGEAASTLKAAAQSASGTSRLEAGNGNQPAVSIEPLTSVLDRHAEFLTARFLKIDTDGFDYRILRGALPWLVQQHPILFFEYDPVLLRLQNEEPGSILPLLRQAGYRHLIAIEEMGTYRYAFDLEDLSLAERLESLFPGSTRGPYADLCVFADADRDLFEQAIRGARPVPTR